jgi:hypothetical protein
MKIRRKDMIKKFKELAIGDKFFINKSKTVFIKTKSEKVADSDECFWNAVQITEGEEEIGRLIQIEDNHEVILPNPETVKTKEFKELAVGDFFSDRQGQIFLKIKEERLYHENKANAIQLVNTLESKGDRKSRLCDFLDCTTVMPINFELVEV